jgi:tetratricopeptide (TPR) repeat protein
MSKIIKYSLLFSLLLLQEFSIAQGDLKSLGIKAFKSLEQNLPNTEKLANELLDKATQANSNSHIINAYTILGILNKNKGYYISSLNYYLKALNFSEKINDNGRVSASLNNIGVIYQLQNNYETAIKYFNKSLKLEDRLNIPLQKSIRYYNIGDCYKEINSFDLALSYFNNSLIIEQKYNNAEGIIYAQLGISEVYLEIGQVDDGKRILDKVALNLKSEFIESNIIYNKLLGLFLFKKGESAKSLALFNVAKEISVKYKYPNHLLEIYKCEIKVLESMKNWISLSSKYKQLIDLNDQLSAIEIRNKIHDLTYNNEIHKKDIQISRIQGERDFAEKMNLFTNKLTWFLIIMLISVVVFVFYGVNKRKK